MSIKINVKPTELKKVLSLKKAEHPDVEELAKEVVRELKTMWHAQDHYAIMMLDLSEKAIYTFGVYYTQKQADNDLLRQSSLGPGTSRGWVRKAKCVPDVV